MKKFLIAILFILPLMLLSQKKDSVKILFFQPHYGAFFPGGDMADRFGFCNNVGAGLFYKNKNNFVFGTDFNFYFGNKIKNADSLFNGVNTAEAFLIDGDGQFAALYLYERGFSFNLIAGKQLSVGKKHYGGLNVLLSAGFLQHKIRIENPESTAPIASGEYKKLFDFLSNGISISQYVGYNYLGKKKVSNFSLGLEITEAFTQGRRDYLYPLKGPDNAKRLDLLFGLKFGWILPLFEKSDHTKYYFY